MTDTDFETWFAYHVARFTGIGAWLAKFRITPSQAEVRYAWADSLRDVSLDDARAATDSLHRGDEELPKSFDDHPRYVRRLAGRFRSERSQKKNRRHFIDGEETVACLKCQDTGNLQAWHVLAVKAARRSDLFHPMLNPEARGQPYKTCVRCNCDAGNAPKNAAFEPYNPVKHFLVVHESTDDSWLRLMDAVVSVQVASEIFNPDAWST